MDQLPALSGDNSYSFDCVRQLEGVPPEIVLVPPTGHTLGHAGIAVERTGGNSILQAAMPISIMSRWTWRIHAARRACAFMMDGTDRRPTLLNQRRLRELKRDHAKAVRIMS